jgi:hypothetical protein
MPGISRHRRKGLPGKFCSPGKLSAAGKKNDRWACFFNPLEKVFPLDRIYLLATAVQNGQSTAAVTLAPAGGYPSSCQAGLLVVRVSDCGRRR